jgi:hypothetical protein
MSDLDSRCEKCERDIEQLWGAVAKVIELVKGVLAQVDEVLGKVEMGTLAQVDEVLGKVEICNRQMFADLQAQTDAGFARLRASIDAASRTERKDDEPPKLN